VKTAHDAGMIEPPNDFDLTPQSAHRILIIDTTRPQQLHDNRAQEPSIEGAVRLVVLPSTEMLLHCAVGDNNITGLESPRVSVGARHRC
jgi:hypothetical protein